MFSFNLHIGMHCSVCIPALTHIPQHITLNNIIIIITTIITTNVELID